MSTALANGDLIDEKYRIVRFIGSGAWAMVYEGINVRIGRRVAIKILSDESVSKPGIVERFEREAQSATRIESDHVVGVFDLGTLADGRPYIVMELLDGEDLAARLAKNGALPPDQAVFFVVQALRGLADAHAAGVMHRDIKPDNVVLVKSKSGDEVVKIVDFGISKLHSGSGPQVTSMTQTNAVLGSPVYMSPEQCRGVRHMDHRSDLFSIGVVLFESLTGQLPHRADTFNELMFKIALEDAPSPAKHKPDLDPTLCAIVTKALARAPDARYQTAAEFEDALTRWAADHGLEPESWFATRRRTRLRVTIDDSAGQSSPTQRPNPLSDTLGADGEALRASGTRRSSDSESLAGSAPAQSASAPNRWKLYAGLGAAAAALLLVVGLAVGRSHPEDPSPPADPSALATASEPTAGTTGSEQPSPDPSASATASAEPEPPAEPEPEPGGGDSTPSAPAHHPVVRAGKHPAGGHSAAASSASAAPPPASAKAVVDGRSIRTNF